MPHGDQRGGYRRPRDPAAVSGPGSMSQRTDGQPIRVPSGGDYGARQQLESQQKAQRLPEAPGAPEPGSAAPEGAPPGQAPGGGGLGDVFAPTARPEEAPQQGTDSVLPEDPDETLRAVYSVTRSEDIRRLLEWRENMRSRPPPEPPRERRTPGKPKTPTRRPQNNQPPRAAAQAPPAEGETRPGTSPEPPAPEEAEGPPPTQPTGNDPPPGEPAEPPPGEGA